MRALLARAALVLAALLGLAAPASAAPDAAASGLVAVPALRDPVTDLAGLLSPAQRSDLDARLRAFSESHGSQIAVLTVPTTRPEAIEQYSIRVTDAWKLGRKGVDDGVLILVARDDHAMRIEVGYGLEGRIPDAVAKRIVSDVMAPRFKAGDFAGGLGAAVDHLSALIEGRPLPGATASGPARDASAAASAAGSAAEPTLTARQQIALLLLVVVVIGAEVVRAVAGPLAAGGAGAATAGVLCGLASGSIGFGLACAGAALLIGLVGLLNLLLIGLQIASGGGGGGWGGGGGRGGGFSGGGGGFGGGGASGSWR